MSDTRYDGLGLSLADGDPIDFAHLTETVGSREEARLLEGFQKVHDIVRFHQEQHRRPLLESRVIPIEAIRAAMTGAAPAPPVLGAARPEGVSRPEAPPLSDVVDYPEGMWLHLGLREVLGRGTFGTVYRAHDIRLDREVALKLAAPHDAVSDPAGTVSAAILEGRKLARVRHPHVVTVYGAERGQGRDGIWMELVEGRTLHDLVADDGPLGEREAIGAGLDVARALSAVHAAGLVHRDVKAHNVMRETGGRLVLMDLGSGVDHAAGGGPHFTGTPLYMAPELFGDAPASVTTDVYAVGVLLYYLVSGEYPVDARSLEELTENHRAGRRVSLRERRGDLSTAFVQVVERALDPDPSRRIASAAALERELAGLSGSPSPATSSTSTGSASSTGGTGPAAPSQTWTRSQTRTQTRTRTRIVGLAVALGLVVVSAVVLLPILLGGGAGPYTLDATFWKRTTDGGAVPLAAGDAIGVGDGVFLDLGLERSLHVYVVNQDDTGAAWLLFPLPGYELQNPVPEGSHRLPGRWMGRSFLWEISSAGGNERFYLVTSPEPVAELEAELGRLPSPRMESPVLAAELGDEVMHRLRGAGRVAEDVSAVGGHAPTGILGEARPLAAGPESVSGMTVRELVLANPR